MIRAKVWTVFSFLALATLAFPVAWRLDQGGFAPNWRWHAVNAEPTGSTATIDSVQLALSAPISDVVVPAGWKVESDYRTYIEWSVDASNGGQPIGPGQSLTIGFRCPYRSRSRVFGTLAKSAPSGEPLVQVSLDDDTSTVEGPYSPPNSVIEVLDQEEFDLHNGPSYAYGISNDGTVVLGDSSGYATIWTSAGREVITKAGLPLQGYAAGISEDGVVVGFDALQYVPFLWDRINGYRRLFPGNGWPSAISADGSTIVGSGWNGSAWQPAKWTSNGVMTLLPQNSGAPILNQQATFCNQDGSVVVGSRATWQQNAWAETSTAWPSSGSPLDSLPWFYGLGFTTFSAYNSCDLLGGNLCGYGRPPGQGQKLMSYYRQLNSAAVLATMIPNLGIEDTIAWAIATSGDGGKVTVVGTTNIDAFFFDSTAPSGTVSLRNYLLDNGVPGAENWQSLQVASAITPDAQYIVGWGRYGDSVTRAFRVRNPTAISSVNIRPIGDLPGGTFDAMPQAVSNEGEAVVGLGSTPDGVFGFRWTPIEGMTPIAAESTYPIALSTSGHLMAAELVGLGARLLTPGGNVNPISSQPGPILGMSGDGRVIVGKAGTSTGQVWAYREFSDGSGMNWIGELPGGANYSEAIDASYDGSVITGSGNSSNGLEPWVWDSAHGMEALGTTPGGSYEGQARAISADGTTVVGYDLVAGAKRAFRWRRDIGMVRLTDPEGLFENSEALGASENGAIVVGTGYAPSIYSGGQTAFLWTANTGMVPLFRYLQDAGIDSVGWTALTEATAISDDGNFIVGRGVRSARRSAFIATIPTQLVPFTIGGMLEQVVPGASGSVQATWSLVSSSDSANGTMSLPAAGGQGVILLPFGFQAGAYTLKVKPDGFLSETVSVTVSADGGTGPSMVFRNGDLDSSGEVDAADIDKVIQYFGQVVGDQLYQSDSRADADRSGEVDAADIDIVIVNFGGVDN